MPNMCNCAAKIRKLFRNSAPHSINPNNSQVSEQRAPTCLHDWPSRDETQLLLKSGTNLRIIIHISP